ncbi:MAG: hypothetical protein K8S87_02520 [Planctomycetes bacterium]|nr:hypothetical protein [Planctomycetota bacterium]
MKRSRLSKLLSPLPDWLEIILSAVVFILYYIAGFICFCTFTYIVYYAGLVLFGTNQSSFWVWEVGITLVPALSINFLISLISITWFLSEYKSKYSIQIGLGLTIPFSVFFSFVCNYEVSSCVLVSREFSNNYLIFFATFLFMMLVKQYLLKRIEVKSPVLAEAIENERNDNDSQD